MPFPQDFGPISDLGGHYNIQPFSVKKDEEGERHRHRRDIIRSELFPAFSNVPLIPLYDVLRNRLLVLTLPLVPPDTP
jgi:hypothetical protein